MKIITINVPESQVEFFDKLKKLGIVPSRSEGMRQCITIGMSYFSKMLNFLAKPLTEDEINNIIAFQEAITKKKVKDKMLEYKEQMSLKPEFRKEEYKNLNHAKIPIGNIYWDDRFVDGKFIKVPVEPNDEDSEEVYVDGKGYVPINRLEDIEE